MFSDVGAGALGERMLWRRGGYTHHGGIGGRARQRERRRAGLGSQLTPGKRQACYMRLRHRLSAEGACFSMPYASVSGATSGSASEKEHTTRCAWWPTDAETGALEV